MCIRRFEPLSYEMSFFSPMSILGKKSALTVSVEIPTYIYIHTLAIILCVRYGRDNVRFLNNLQSLNTARTAVYRTKYWRHLAVFTR